MHLINNSSNKWSKNFDKRLNRMLCPYWRPDDPSCSVHNNRFPMLFNRPDNPTKIASSRGGYQTPSNTWFCRTTQINSPTSISIISAVLTGLIILLKPTKYYVLQWYCMGWTTPNFPLPVQGFKSLSNINGW